jgi:hypothetical protein
MQGYVRCILVEKDIKTAPPPGKAWLILSGTVLHVAATTTVIGIYGTSENRAFFRTIVASANATAEYPLFPTTAGDLISQFTHAFVTALEYVYLTGDTGVQLRLMVIEFPDE